MHSTSLTVDRCQSGFTLLEILLVITLIAVASAMVVPSFVSFSDGDVNDEARRLQQALRLASEEAQLTGQPIRATLLKDGYYFASLSGESQWTKLSETPFDRYQLPQGVEVESVEMAAGFESSLFSEADLAERENGYVGRVTLWPDGLLDQADIALLSISNQMQSVIQARSGPRGIRAKDQEEQ